MHDDRRHFPKRPIADLFELGKVVATPAALKLLLEKRLEPLNYVNRHRLGDWGEVDALDLQTNEAALNEGGRLFSSYEVEGQARVWVITEADRSFTTLLTPEDY